MASQASAIDDSFCPVNVYQGSAEVPQDGYQDHEQSKGPRAGHWTVLSTANGSAIDDRRPTVLGMRSRSHSIDGIPDRVHTIDRTLLRKLAAATERERKPKEEEAKSRADGRLPIEEVKRQYSVKAEGEKKGFHIPRAQDAHGIRIRGRDGKVEIVRHPSSRPKPTVGDTHKKTDTKEETTKIAAPPAPAAAGRSASTPSHASRRNANVVRIAGKNGKESFVELPFLTWTSQSVDAGRPEIQLPPPESAAADHAKEKKKRDAAAAREAKQLREERIATEQKEKRGASAEKEAKRLREERMAADALMHSALPAASIESPVARSGRHSKTSSNVSEQRAPRVFDMTSKPASVASSNTSMAKLPTIRKTTGHGDSVKGGNARSKQSSVAGWQEVGFGTYEPAVSIRDISRRSRDPTPPQKHPDPQNSTSPISKDCRPTPNVAVRPQKAPVSRPASFQYSYRHSSNAQRLSAEKDEVKQQPFQSVMGSEHTRSLTGSATVDSFPLAVPQGSNHSSPNMWQQSDIGLRSDMQLGPTVFAGRGWISPHPLSEAPTYARQEPDPIIQLPPGAPIHTGSGAETMTYEEWLAVQNHSNNSAGSRAARSNAYISRLPTQNRIQSTRENVREVTGRRNISITESHDTREYAAGSWGFRAGQPSGQGYQSPSVKTEGVAGDGRQDCSHRSYVASNAGKTVSVEDQKGNAKTWLRMPWDQEANKEPRTGSRSSDGFW